MKDHQSPGLTARFKLGKVDDVEATVTLTGRLAFFREAADALSKGQASAYGAWQVIAALRSVVSQAEQTFYDRIPGEEEKS